jgi:hypothetical protein
VPWCFADTIRPAIASWCRGAGYGNVNRRHGKAKCEDCGFAVAASLLSRPRVWAAACASIPECTADLFGVEEGAANGWIGWWPAPDNCRTKRMEPTGQHGFPVRMLWKSGGSSATLAGSMTMDFTRIARHPAPDELLAKLCEFVPGFREPWPESLFIHADGSFTVHGVFAEFSSYVRSHFGEFDEDTRRKLFEYVEQCVTTDIHSESGVSNAACTEFLENIAGEGELSRAVKPYLGPESRKYFDQWNG